MAEEYIVFHTTSKNDLRISDGCDGLSIDDLETILRLSHEAVNAIEGELEKRRTGKVPDHNNGIRDCRRRLQQTCRKLVVMGRLEGRASKQVKEAVAALTDPCTDGPSKAYQSFLCDVLHHCHEGIVLLCASSLGKKRVVDIGSNGRVALLAYLKETREFDKDVLRRLAHDSRVPLPNSTQLANVPVQYRKADQRALPSLVDLSGDTRQSASLAGDVYDLTVEDARAAVASDQVRGQVWLTNPYDQRAWPFITVSITRVLGVQFAARRKQIM